jgi:uncharacterized membrane protein
MTKRDRTIAISATAAAAGFAIALASRRSSRDVTEYRARTARTVTVRRDATELHAIWRERFPEFFRGVSAVERTGNGRERWSIPSGKRVRLIDVAVVDDAPGERVAWHAEKFGAYAAHGLVTFNPIGARGSEVRLSLALDGPVAKTNAAFARLFGLSPAQIAAESLRNFKALAETGEIPKAVHN